MEETQKNNKQQRLKKFLAERICSGEFAFMQRFPGIHELMASYSISHVTAMKALQLLEAEGYLRCRRGLGYYVSYATPDSKAPTKKLNFIVHRNVWALHENFFKEEFQRFQDTGWAIDVVQLESENLENSNTAAVALNSPDTYSILFGFRADWRRFAATFTHVCNRVIVMGQLSGSNHITSVICDESEAMRQALQYLRSQGRVRTALFCSFDGDELEMLRSASWQRDMLLHGADFAWLQEHLFNLHCDPDGKNNMANITKQQQEYLTRFRGTFDSVIVAQAMKHFPDCCRKAGLKIGTDIVPVTFRNPRWNMQNQILFPAVDNNLSAHFTCAHQILEHRFLTGQKEANSWYFCQPLGVIEP